MALGIVAAGTGSPVSIATDTLGGIIKTDIAPSGTYGIALTHDAYPAVAPVFGGGFQVSPTGGAGGLQVYDANGTTTIGPDFLVLQRVQDNHVPFKVDLAAGASGTELQMNDSVGALMWGVEADGTQELAGGFGINGVAPPGFPVLATGASHTVDDVITLLQSYGFCKQS